MDKQDLFLGGSSALDTQALLKQSMAVKYIEDFEDTTRILRMDFHGIRCSMIRHNGIIDEASFQGPVLGQCHGSNHSWELSLI